jgi:hypothetical protein
MRYEDPYFLKLDHLLFGALLVGLLLMPKLPLPIEQLPEKSGAPIAILVLLIWMVLRPGWLSLRSARHSPEIAGLVLFALYAFAISLASFNEISILYAAQYLIYVCVGSALLNQYLTKAVAADELTTTIRILAVVGLVYASAVVLSVFYGPVYEAQVLSAERRWQGFKIPQGVGFAEGPNNAAAVLLAVVPIVLLLFRPKRAMIHWLFGSLLLMALVMTISRSALLSFVLALGALGAVTVVRWILRAHMPIRAVSAMVLTTVSLVTIWMIVEGVVYETASEEFGKAIAVGMGFGETAIVSEDMELRARFWEEAVDTWMNSPAYEQLFGKGFRAIFQLNDDELAWASPHSAYLGMLVDCGIIGLVLFITPLLRFVLSAGLEICRSKPTAIKKTSYVVVLALMGHNLSEVFFYSPVVITLVLIILLLSAIEDRTLWLGIEHAI